MTNTQTWQRLPYTISTDKTKLDLQLLHQFFQSSYWAQNRTMQDIVTMIDHSICFGLYEQDKQIGFGRVLSDISVMSYLADVFVVSTHRGQGLGTWLTQTILECSLFSETKKWLLATKDAHDFYKQFGFTSHPYPERMMIRVSG